MSDSKGAIFEFDDFRLDVSERLFTRDGQPVELSSKAFDLLLALVENSGRLVEKRELYNRLWAGQFVEDSNLTVQMSAIRKALGDGSYIKTVKGHGYRFVADVRELNGHRDEFVGEQQTFVRITVEHEIEDSSGSHKAQKRLATSSNASTIAKVVAAAVAGVALFVAGFWYLNTSNIAPEIRQPKLTRLTSSGNVHAVTSTPDGKYAVLVLREKEGESLWLRQIETGSQTRITQPENIEYLGLTVSPDGNFVYAPVFLENSAEPPLRKIPILGGPAQVISNAVSSSVSFSPDGKQIAYTESHQPETHLVVANADGRDARDLIRAHNDKREFPIWKYHPVAWSPDGVAIAASYSENSENGTLAGITLVDPISGSEQLLIEPSWAHIDEVAWLDTDNLVFIANEDEWANQIWTVNRKSGAVRRITSDLNKYRWLTTVVGKLLTTQVTAVSTLKVAEIGGDAKNVSPREIASESGYFSNVAWGRDDEILFSSVTTGEPEIWRIDTDGKNARQLTADANIFFGMAVSPTSGSIVYSAKHERKFSIWKMDKTGKNPTQITDGVEDFAPDVSSNGTVVYQTSSQKVMRRSPTDNISVELHAGLKPVISPDGSQTAFFMMDRGKWKIGVVATETGQVIKKIDFPANVRQRRMRWHPSGEYLSLFFEEGSNLKLLCVFVGREDSWIIDGFGTGDVSSFSWAPDGKQLVYSVTTETRDAILLSDF